MGVRNQLHSTGQTGWPTEKIPQPQKDTVRMIGTNGYPDAAEAIPTGEQERTPTDAAEIRRQKRAQHDREMKSRAAVYRKLWIVFKVSPPIKMPHPRRNAGAKEVCFSRACEERKKCRQKYFNTVADMADHVLRVHGTPEIDAEWARIRAEAERPAETDPDPEAESVTENELAVNTP